MDSEIIALTALGISRRRILWPVGVLAAIGAALTLVMTLWLAPLAIRTFRAIESDLITSQISFQVQPRVFDERFPHMVLYINDVSASGTRWNGVFLAEAGGESGSRITLAESAIVIAEPRLGKLELHLNGGSTHEFSVADAENYSVTAFRPERLARGGERHGSGQGARAQQPGAFVGRPLERSRKGWRDARVELHQRFAFPVACLVFALIAVPLGRSRGAAGALRARCSRWW